MVPFNIIFLLALIKLSVSQALLNSYFKLYAKDFDATIPFIRQYQYYEYKTAGPSKNIGLIECMAYCIDAGGCYSITLAKTNNEFFCRIFATIPVLGIHIAPANASFVYVDASNKIFFCIRTQFLNNSLFGW